MRRTLALFHGSRERVLLFFYETVRIIVFNEMAKFIGKLKLVRKKLENWAEIFSPSRQTNCLVFTKILKNCLIPRKIRVFNVAMNYTPQLT